MSDTNDFSIDLEKINACETLDELNSVCSSFAIFAPDNSGIVLTHCSIPICEIRFPNLDSAKSYAAGLLWRCL